VSIEKKQTRCKCGCGLEAKDSIIEFMRVIETIYGSLLHYYSWARCDKQNTISGGKPTSSHKKGLAVDIGCNNSIKRLKLLKIIIMVAESMGLPIRVGMSGSYLHIDIDRDKVECIWVY
jgi:hypothetical protein